jgi:hypothetical protein
MAPGASKPSKYAEEVAVLRKHATKLRQLTSSNTKPNLRSHAVAQLLPLSYHRFRCTWLSLPIKLDRIATNTRLSEEQDLVLERYLDAIDAIGFGIHRGLVQQQAYMLLEESYMGVDETLPTGEVLSMLLAAETQEIQENEGKAYGSKEKVCTRV